MPVTCSGVVGLVTFLPSNIAAKSLTLRLTDSDGLVFFDGSGVSAFSILSTLSVMCGFGGGVGDLLCRSGTFFSPFSILSALSGTGGFGGGVGDLLCRSGTIFSVLVCGGGGLGGGGVRDPALT